jgi:hypothetical protein
MRLKFKSGWLNNADERFMKLWGSEDCYFEIDEIAALLGTSVEELEIRILKLRAERKDVYWHFIRIRKARGQQNRFEDRVVKCDNMIMNDELTWDENSVDTKSSTNTLNHLHGRKTKKNVDRIENMEV